MLRVPTVLLLLGGPLAAAPAPAHRQPTPATVGDPGSPDVQKNQAEMDKLGRDRAEQQKSWDAKMKRTMGGVCRGC
ncbi:hypothetical protein [Methylobacterium nigriterrae]|uniref:hypothetical protein n=1 Tax=Methylobacterium nigriterrae TaxID=3127512 RepID=UPI0030133FE4